MKRRSFIAGLLAGAAALKLAPRADARGAGAAHEIRFSSPADTWGWGTHTHASLVYNNQRIVIPLDRVQHIGTGDTVLIRSGVLRIS